MSSACAIKPQQHYLKALIVSVLLVVSFSLWVHVASVLNEVEAPSTNPHWTNSGEDDGSKIAAAQELPAAKGAMHKINKPLGLSLRNGIRSAAALQNRRADLDGASRAATPPAPAKPPANAAASSAVPPQAGVSPVLTHTPMDPARPPAPHALPDKVHHPATAAAAGTPPLVSQLHHGHPSATCTNHFDFGMLQAWNALRKPFCAASSAGAAASSSALQCRVTVDRHLPGPTAPHTVCDGKDIVLSWKYMTPTNCVAHRPGYMCGGPAIWWQYAPGAVGGTCEPTEHFKATAFPKDHLRSLFGSWKHTASPLPNAKGMPVAAPVTVLVTRERGEHANWFHTTTDILNAFIALHMAGVIDAKLDGGTYSEDVVWYKPPASQNGAGVWWQSPATEGAFVSSAGGGDGGVASMRAIIKERVAVLIMDTQDAGPFDQLWALLYAPQHSTQRSGALQAKGGQLLLPHAVFSPPGYTSFLLSHLSQDADCVQATHLMRSFSRFVLSSLGVQHLMPRVLPGSLPPMVITVVSRRPYEKGAVSHKSIGRQIENEPELVAALKAAGRAAAVRVHAELVDLAHLTITQQIQLVAHSDVLVGMHGAALSHLPYLPPWGGALELWPKQRDMWRCFEHLARWSGVLYSRWANQQPSAFRQDALGDYTRVHPGQVQAVAIGLLREVLVRRKKWADSAVQSQAGFS